MRNRMSTLYRLINIDKKYPKQNIENAALKGINFDIEEGEIIVILGPSGSGKSTLLNVLSGIDTPSNGSILFNDQKLEQLKEKELTEYRKNNLGFIFQSYNLVSNLTVTENIELGSNLSEKPFPMKQILEIVELTDHKGKYPYQLSGGQMQRVAIARALIKNPKVLFCDEPTGALDEETGKKILESLQEINKKYHTTMIIVTHNPSIAEMAHTVIKMNSGKVVEFYHNTKRKNASDLRWA